MTRLETYPLKQHPTQIFAAEQGDLKGDRPVQPPLPVLP